MSFTLINYKDPQSLKLRLFASIGISDFALTHVEPRRSFGEF